MTLNESENMGHPGNHPSLPSKASGKQLHLFYCILYVQSPLPFLNGVVFEPQLYCKYTNRVLLSLQLCDHTLFCVSFLFENGCGVHILSTELCSEMCVQHFLPVSQNLARLSRYKLTNGIPSRLVIKPKPLLQSAISCKCCIHIYSDVVTFSL